MTGDIVNGNCTVAMSSIFGWLLSGPVSHHYSLVVIGKDKCTSKNDFLIQMLRHFWDNEAIVIHEIAEESKTAYSISSRYSI